MSIYQYVIGENERSQRRCSFKNEEYMPLSLYVHMPWCVQKCPYCDFNSHQKKAELPEADYIKALLADLKADLARYKIIKSERSLSSIFIGGGTPSLISAQGIGELLQGINEQIPFLADIEITMEANPGTLESAPLADYQAQGINRISLGVQSFANDKLHALGRIHNANEAVTAAQSAQQLSLKSFNLDLMHGLPNQSISEALADLKQAIALKPPHLSWYQLTIEPNTLFYSKPPTLPDDDELWQIFEQGHQLLEKAGYQQYEVSGYSLPNHQCQHNLNYWRFGDYLGIGCGAHGKITTNDGQILRTTKIKHPKGYLAVQKDLTKSYRASETEVSEQERPFEYFMNRFRLTESCPKQEFIDRTGLSLAMIDEPIQQAIKQGYLSQTDTHWQTTTKGRLFFNDLVDLFLGE